ncbi:MAG: hypothetical protein OZ921_02600 [Sorangiineae bacterium]|nr:hypothetical protein [Polyangiaceae bacterium]MEB2321376.1 hypothetical protein [Sorangiineae bacterium]
MRAQDWTVLSAVALAAASLGLYACGGDSSREANAPTRTGSIVHAAGGEDVSRCDYQGRADREVQETTGPGALVPNIRRVYAIIGAGEDRRRVIACREVDTNLDGQKDVVRTYDAKGEPLHELADANYDGKIDTWTTFSGGRIVKVEIDTNGDGRPDEIRFMVRGKLSRLQRDTNFDGKPDVWEIYDDGRLQRIGWDFDFDGHVDRWDRDLIALHDEERREAAEAEKAEQADAGAGDAAPAN